MSLATPDKIRSLQRKLYGKAKAEPDYRFYLLYDKICRADILEHAYALARDNAGAPGVDGNRLQADRGGGRREVACRVARGSRLEDLPAPGRATGDDPEAGRRRTPARHSHDSGPGGADRRQPPGFDPVTEAQGKRRADRSDVRQEFARFTEPDPASS